MNGESTQNEGIGKEDEKADLGPGALAGGDDARDVVEALAAHVQVAHCEHVLVRRARPRRRGLARGRHLVDRREGRVVTYCKGLACLYTPMLLLLRPTSITPLPSKQPTQYIAHFMYYACSPTGIALTPMHVLGNHLLLIAASNFLRQCNMTYMLYYAFITLCTQTGI